MNVVLLPAGGERRRVWDPVIAALAPAGYHCVAVQQRDRDEGITLDALVADVASLVQALDGPVVLVGASLGGFVSLLVADADPDKVAGVVLVDVVPDPDPDATRAFLGPLGLITPLVDEILGRAAELRAALASLRVPVALVRGGASPVHDDTALERVLALAPRATLATVPGAGHLVARDRPVLLAGVLLGVLAGITSGPATGWLRDARARAHELLAARGAATVSHLGGDLLTHLRGTEARLWSWGAPPAVALAGLTHAAYGTAGFAAHLLALDEREVLAAAVGAEAEAVVYAYAACDRDALAGQLGRHPLVLTDRFTGAKIELDEPAAAAFALVSAANELDLVDRGVFDAPTQVSVHAFVDRLAPYARSWLPR